MKVFSSVALGSLALALCVGCGSTPSSLSPEKKAVLAAQVSGTVKDYQATDPDMERFFKSSYAYAVFPEVASAAIGVGGAHGNGEVYKGGVLVGYADVSKGDIGFQLGAQNYSQIVFFQNEATFASFTSGSFDLDAKASAVAASKGASTSANYEKGVLVFTRATGGLMFQAAVGGQKFRYVAK